MACQEEPAKGEPANTTGDIEKTEPAQVPMKPDGRSCWPWKPRCEPAVSASREERILATVFGVICGEGIATKEEVDQYPPDHFLKQPFSNPSAAHLLRYGAAQMLAMALGIFCMGWAAKTEFSVQNVLLRYFGTSLTTFFLWPVATDLFWDTTLVGHSSRYLGVATLPAVLAMLLPPALHIPVDGGATAGFLGTIGLYTFFFPMKLSKCLALPSLRKNWRWATSVLHYMLMAAALAFHTGNMLFHLYVVAALLPSVIAALLVPLEVSLIETLLVLCHKLVYKKLQWPAIEKAARTLEDTRVPDAERKTAWAGGDILESVSNGVFFQAMAGETFRLGILFNAAVTSPTAIGSAMQSLGGALVLNVVIRTGLLARALRLAPGAVGLFYRECKILSGYPRFPVLLGILLGRMLLLGDLGAATFSKKGLAPLVVLVGSFVFEITEDVVVHFMKRRVPVPSAQARAQGLHPLDPARKDGPVLEICRAPVMWACFHACICGGWLMTALGFTLGYELLLGCTDDETGVDWQALFVVFKHSGCSRSD